MVAPWFYCPDVHAGEVMLDGAEAEHALKSLRLSAGDATTLFDGRGHVGHGTLRGDAATGRGRKAARQAIVNIDAIDAVPLPARTLTLIVAGCKGARLEWLAEKATELGVTRLVLAEFEHSVVHTGAAHATRLGRTALAACKQCRRAWLPEITAGVTLADVLAAQRGALVAAHLDGSALTFVQWLVTRGRAAADLAVVIGPEGGLAAVEVAAVRAAGGEIVRLTEHVLRVETAALAAAAQWAGVTLAS
ncbi:MAG: 16S rRNA (uracil(1498)-N(3))-methyltransferase [Phycisphaerae bacterium]|nr:16S rRNA (uracil(1498)-N(3))-methyltransferase [Phycisphaerae bacterium]